MVNHCFDGLESQGNRLICEVLTLYVLFRYLLDYEGVAIDDQIGCVCGSAVVQDM